MAVLDIRKIPGRLITTLPNGRKTRRVGSRLIRSGKVLTDGQVVSKDALNVLVDDARVLGLARVMTVRVQVMKGCRKDEQKKK